MKRILFLLFAVLPLMSQAQSSPTEGVLTADFVNESTMKQDLLQMLADFALYMKNDFQDCQYPNSIDEACGCFKGENTMGNDERGVRPNADLSMVCAFLVKYGKPAGVTLPSGVTWADLETMAMKSLIFAYSTHKANKLKVCSGGNYWGSLSTSDSVWESSLWAMSVAYSAFFQWDQLTDAQKGYIEALLKAECNYELGRSIPTGYAGDTKAEENGWEADILAATLGLFPDDALAPQWFERLRQFAVNSYSHATDLQKQQALDAWYNGKSASDLYLGKNIYDDYTLQNHNMFHTSYLNVVMQELGEAALALKMFQLGTKGSERWHTTALMHNNQAVMDEVLNWLATSDGELAMPNGNDWSLFLFDQITSYSTQACFQRDANALLLENLAYKNIKARQTTTTDGSWLLQPDVGARRMGVEAHRVMMTYLMHEVASTADLTAPTWQEFRTTFGKTKYFPAQNIVRSMSKDRFTCFSWNTSLPDYSGVIVPNDCDKAKIMVPFRTHHTGNLLGVYSRADYTASLTGHYSLFPNAYAMNGVVQFNGIPQAFCLYATSGNAVILVDALKANSATTVSSEQGGMMGISVDKFTHTQRTIYYNGGSVTTDGASYSTWTSPWSNIDNYLGFVVTKHGETVQGAFGDKSNNNSIMTAKIYPSYNGSNSAVGTSMNHIRGFVYYTGVTAAETQELSAKVQDLTTLGSWPEGWHGVLVPDPDGTYYLLLSNLFASDDTPWENLSVTCPLGAPVFRQITAIAGANSTATFYCPQNYNIANELKVFVSGATVLNAVQADENSRAVYLQNEQNAAQTVTVSIIDADGTTKGGSVSVPANGCVLVKLNGGTVVGEPATWPGDYRNVAYGASVSAGSYDGAHLPFNCIDGDDATYYKSLNTASSGTEQLTLSLRNQYQIDKIVVTPQPGLPAPTSIIAQYGDDESSLTALPNVTTASVDGNTVLTFDAVPARFVRLQLLGSSQVAVQKVAVYGSVSNSKAETSTIDCFENPSFEADNISTLTIDNTRGAYVISCPANWTMTGDTPDVHDIMTASATATDNNFGAPGAPTDGSQMFYLRVGWYNWATTLSTTSSLALPAGKYRISFDYRTGYANSAASSFVFSCAGVSNSSVTFNKGGLSGWQTASIEFTLTSAQTITPQIVLTWKSGGSSFLMDNLTLEEIIDATDYSALHKEQMIQNGGDATFLLQDPKCESAAGTAWNGSTGAITLREHWSGEGYQDTYQERTASGTVSQTLSDMPRGTYKLVAALRANTGCTITPRLNSTSGATFTGTGNASTTVPQINKNGVQMPYDASRGFTTRGTGRGWQWGSVTATTSEDGSLTVAFDMSGSSWMSIDDVHLYYISDGTDTFCESINADAATTEVTTNGKTVTADIIVQNPNTVIHSETQVFTDNAAANNNLVGGTSMERLVLYDGYDFACATTGFSLAEASYQRAMTNTWGTLLLPYPIVSNEQVQLYRLLGLSADWLWFEKTDAVPANTPCVFRKLKGSSVSIEALSAEAVGTDQPQDDSYMTASDVEGMGYYTAQTITDKTTYYIAEDKFWRNSSSLQIPAFRAVFRTTKSTAKTLGIRFDEALPTAIIDMVNDAVPQRQDDSLYDLQGRRIPLSTTLAQPLPRGIYLFGTRKVLVK